MAVVLQKYISRWSPEVHSRISQMIALPILMIVVASPMADVWAQDDRPLANVFPGTTVVFLEVDHPDQLIEKMERHPVTQRVQQLPTVEGAFKTPQALLGMVAVKLIEAELGQTLLESIKENCSHGLAIGMDPATDGVAILFRAEEEAKLRRLAGVILNTISRQNAGGKPPFEKKDYRDAVAAQFDKVLVARFKNWFVISNKNELAKQIVDNLHDGAQDSLADQAWFIEARSSRTADDVWLAADLESLRNAGVAKELFQGTTDNPAAELILGGVFDALKHAPAVSATLNLEQNLQVRASLPFEGSWASKSRQFFYGQNLSGSGPEPLLPQNLVASLTTYRDVADWWLSKEDLFEESVIAQLAQADSQLSTIFSGMDFGEDVLGALQPRMQIVVTENTYAEKYQPDVKLPAFALVGKLKDPEKIQRKLKIAFQSVIGFANINLGMQGQPQLEMETETIDGAKISSAQYYYEADTPDGLMLFNFSPTVAFQDELVILASTRSLAVELAQLGQQSGQADGGGSRERTESKSNTHLKLDAKVLNEILEANLDSLVTQNMLTEGSTKEEAEQAIQTMLSIINLFEGMDFDYRIESDQMKFDLELKAKSLSQNRSGSSAETR